MPNSVASVEDASREPPSKDSSDDEAMEPPDLSRLPKGVVPKRYELKLDVYPTEERFEGVVNIRLFFFASGTSVIWLHCSPGLLITEASVRFSQFALPVGARSVIKVPKYEAVGIRLREPLEAGTRAWLTVKYHGQLSHNLEGFFVFPCKNRDGETVVGAATMLAPTHARSVFPCFDEPAFKAVFALEVTVADHLMVASNMPLQDSRYIRLGRRDSETAAVKEGKVDRKDVRRIDYFEWTKEMSTYLVCLVIGDFEFLEVLAAGRTKVRVLAPWGQREQGRFALQVAKKSLEYFNDYFGKRYPLPKLDLVALNRLSVGAMENWGLITCRETGLIVEEKEGNPDTLQSVANLIAHEVSHQWFGNMVTMSWWDGLYLNEGFATLMASVCVDALYPTFRAGDRFVADVVIPALGLDALRTSHPIETPGLASAAQINQSFDKITYCKAASVLNMVRGHIGPEVFKKAIQAGCNSSCWIRCAIGICPFCSNHFVDVFKRCYIDDFSYDTATSEDLWHHLSEASGGADVGAFLKAWIREVGFPLVSASVVSDFDGSAVLRLEQERFAPHPTASEHTAWAIPLTGVYANTSGKTSKFQLLFDRAEAEVDLPGFDPAHPTCWLKLNPGVTGFFRVHYGEKLFEMLLNHIQDEALRAVDRMAIFDDQVAMVLCDGGSTVRILRMVDSLRRAGQERNAMVWRAVCGVLQQIRSLTWPDQDLADRFDLFCLDMLRPLLASVGVVPRGGEDEDDEDAALLRSSLLPVLAMLREEEVLAFAKDAFKAQLAEVALVAPSIRDGVYRAVMVDASLRTLEQMLTLYRQSELAEDRVSILQALGKASNQDVLERALQFCFDENNDVPAQEAPLALMAAASARSGHRHSWAFFRANLERLAERYSGGLFLFARVIRSVTESFCTAEDCSEVADFMASNASLLVGAEVAAEQALEHTRLNVIWRDKDILSVQQFLDSYFNQ